MGTTYQWIYPRTGRLPHNDVGMNHRASIYDPCHGARLSPQMALRDHRSGRRMPSPSSRCKRLSSSIDQTRLSHSGRASPGETATVQDLALEWMLNDDDPSPPVVSTALSLWTWQPCLPALEVLDRAMRIHADEDLDFQFDGEHELAPPHPFAELIRRAFAPQLDQIELCMSFVESPLEDRELRTRVARTRRRWNRAILRFAERYRIWEPET